MDNYAENYVQMDLYYELDFLRAEHVFIRVDDKQPYIFYDYNQH